MKYSEEAINRVYSGNKYVNTEPSKSGFNVFFNLKIPEKAKDLTWYKNYVNHIVPHFSTTISDYKELKRNYEIYNDDLSSFKDMFKEFCDPLGENLANIDDEIQPFPVIHNKVNVLKGEYLSRSDKYNIVLLSADAVRSKNDAYVDAIKRSLAEELNIELERTMLSMEGMSEEEIQQYVEAKKKELEPADMAIKDFKSDTEIFYEKAIKYGYYTQKIPSLKLESLEDSIIADRFFVHSGWKFGKPHLELRNPLFTGFQKSPNEKYVQKSDYVWYKKPITITEVYNQYGNYLTDEEMSRLGIHRNNSVDARHSLDPQTQKYVKNTFDDELYSTVNETSTNKQVGTSQTQGLHRISNDAFLVWETHIEFKAFRNLIFITYIDDYGNAIVLPSSKDFKIPKTAVKHNTINKWGHDAVVYKWVDFGKEYEAEELWIPWKYEVVRLGEDIYPIYRSVPYQYPNIENPYSSFNLSTYGRVLTDRNARSISLLRRAIPSYLQLLYVKKIQNRELAKYQGFIQDIDADTIPTALGEDINGELIKDPIAVWLIYRKKLGLNIYSGSQTVNGLPAPNTRSPGSSSHIIGTAGDIFNLQQLVDLLSREIGLAMGIPPQREAQFATNSNASDNRQALQQSYYITEPYFFMVDDVWRDIMTDYVNNFRLYCKQLLQRTGRNPMFHYVLPDGTEELLEVTDTMLTMTDIGLFLDSNVNQQKYNDMMMQQAQAFAQNAGEGVEIVSTILKAITNGASTEETHKLIQIASRKQQENQQAMQEQQAKQQQELMKQQADLEKTKHDYKMLEIEQKEKISGEYMLKKTEMELEVQGNQHVVDTSVKLQELSNKNLDK